jgi:hypothetical protein
MVDSKSGNTKPLSTEQTTTPLNPEDLADQEELNQQNMIYGALGGDNNPHAKKITNKVTEKVASIPGNQPVDLSAIISSVEQEYMEGVAKQEEHERQRIQRVKDDHFTDKPFTPQSVDAKKIMSTRY